MTDIVVPESNPTLKHYDSYDDFLQVNDIQIDPTYQRALSPEKIKKIKSAYSEELAGLIYVSQRNDGTVYACDGQHRLTVMSQLGQELCLCRVFTGLTLQDEARIFVICNTARANPDLPSIYKARLISGDAVISALNRTVIECGYSVQLTNGGQRMTVNSIWAINALLDIYNRGTGTANPTTVIQAGIDHLATVLTLIHDTWPDHPEAIKHDILMGVSAFLRRYPDKFNRTEFVTKLSKIDPVVIRRKANYHKSEGGLKPLDATVRSMQVVYDYHRRGMARLEPTID